MENLSMDHDRELLLTKELDRLNINVSCMQRADVEKGRSFSAANPGFNRLYYIRSGSGRIFCGGKVIPMVAGNIYFLPAYSGFSQIMDTDMDVLYFHFNLLRFDYSDLFQCLNGCICLSGREAQIEEMYALEARSAEMAVALKIKTALFQVVAEILEQNGGAPGSIEQYSSLVKRAIRYVEKEKHFGMNAREIASALLISESTLRQNFRKEVGVSVGRYINERLLFAAEQQLRLTTRSVREIATGLGFGDPLYFSKLFSARYGMSPSKYRKVGGE